jgi:hypothetical protein
MTVCALRRPAPTTLQGLPPARHSFHGLLSLFDSCGLFSLFLLKVAAFTQRRPSHVARTLCRHHAKQGSLPVEMGNTVPSQALTRGVRRRITRQRG